MSFSFTAAGTLAETLAVLNRLNVPDPLGSEVQGLLTGNLASASGAAGLRYTVTAYGHSGPGAVMSLSVTVTASVVPALDPFTRT